MLEIRWNPPLDDALVERLVAIWVAATNAGGSVGFVAPVTAEVVRPLARASFAGVGEGGDDLAVAVDARSGEAVGFGFLAPNAEQVTAHWMTVRRLQRDPTRGGEGIGAALLAALEHRAADRGALEVVVTVREGTGRQAYYEARGYGVVGVQPGWLLVSGRRVASVTLRKPVAPGGLAGAGDGADAERTNSPAAAPTGAAPEAATGGHRHAHVVSLPVRRLDGGLPLPAYAHPGDAGLDLRAAEEVALGPGERALVPTGLAVAIPEGYVGLVHPRSGLAVRHGLGLVNAPGTIDAGYRGEVKVALVNHDRTASVSLARGERIAQLVVQPVVSAEVVEVDGLPASSSRGEGGFGSTGR